MLFQRGLFQPLQRLARTASAPVKKKAPHAPKGLLRRRSSRDQKARWRHSDSRFPGNALTTWSAAARRITKLNANCLRACSRSSEHCVEDRFICSLGGSHQPRESIVTRCCVRPDDSPVSPLRRRAVEHVWGFSRPRVSTAEACLVLSLTFRFHRLRAVTHALNHFLHGSSVALNSAPLPPISNLRRTVCNSSPELASRHATHVDDHVRLRMTLTFEQTK